jgi:hypothetical protein
MILPTERRIWLSEWEWHCCGTPFAIAADVEFTVEPAADRFRSWLAPLVGTQVADGVTDVETHHGPEHENEPPLVCVAGCAESIHAIYWRYGRESTGRICRSPIQSRPGAIHRGRAARLGGRLLRSFSRRGPALPGHVTPRDARVSEEGVHGGNPVSPVLNSGVLGELLERLLGRHGLLLGGIVLVAAGVFGSVLFVHPLTPDNLEAMSVGPLHHNPWDYFSGAAHTTHRPFFRPVAELTLWLQYHVLGLDPHTYFGLNVVLWVACAWALYAYVHRASGSRVLGGAAALATLLDGRAILATLWILERQSTIAFLCGFVALLLVLVPLRRRPLVVAICLLLLAAGLAKEYGLAFVVAVPLLAWLQRLRDWPWVAAAGAAALALYVVLRFGIAGGASGRFCDEMGYFRSTRTVCFSQQASFDHFKQKLWNFGASLVGTYVPPLFDPFGTLVTPSARSLVVPAIVTAAAVVAYVKRPRWALPLLALVVLNALLNFVTYRTRNQLIGIGAAYGAAAIGLEWLWVQVAPRAGRYAAAVAAGGVALLVGWLALQAVLRPRTVETFEQSSVATNVCDAARQFPREIDPSVVRRLSQRYGLRAC